MSAANCEIGLLEVVGVPRHEGEGHGALNPPTALGPMHLAQA